MSEVTALAAPAHRGVGAATPVRPEVDYRLPPVAAATRLQPLSPRARLWAQGWLRKGVILALLALAWQLAAVWQDNDLLLPSFTASARALAEGLASGELLGKAAISLGILLQGYALGVVLALGLTTLAVSTRLGRDLLSTLTAMFNPLPAIALLPLALLWFGLGRGSLIFVLIHSVLWPLALNTYAGFQAVPETLRMAGRNYGLRGARYVLQILVPAALPAILSGLKIAWAFAWRTLIAAELVFGVTTGQGGLGWYIYQSKNVLMIPEVFAGLLTVILVGLIVDNLVFRIIENRTVRRWGMQV